MEGDGVIDRSEVESDMGVIWSMLKNLLIEPVPPLNRKHIAFVSDWSLPHESYMERKSVQTSSTFFLSFARRSFSLCILAAAAAA